MEGNFNISGTSPASAVTAVVGSTVTDLDHYESLEIVATLQGATGGTLDVYLQNNPSGDGVTWVDWAHFAQLAAAAPATTVAMAVSLASQQTTPTAVGTGLSPALASTGALGGTWGRNLRCVAKAGASTTAGAPISITICGQAPRYQR